MEQSFRPTHEIESYGPVMVIDEGTEDGSSGAYTAEEFAASAWPRVRLTTQDRWLDYGSGDAEDVTHRVKPYGSAIEITDQGTDRETLVTNGRRYWLDLTADPQNSIG